MRFFYLLLLVSPQVFASAAGGEHHEGIPTVVYWQAANILVMVVLGVYFLRTKIVEFFKQRKAGFIESSAKSKKIQEEAENSLLGLKQKLNILVSTSGEAVERARAEANDLKRATIREANEAAERIQRDAQDNMKLEVEKAKFQLREEVVRDAMAQAKSLLQKDVGQADHKNLQDKFASSLKDVQI